MTPSKKASSTAAAAVPGRLPNPPMITAMKQNGRMSTPPRKSTVVIGAATTPPSARKADGKCEHVDAAGGNAHGEGNLAVVTHGPHPGAELGVLQEQEEATECKNGHGRDEQPVNLVIDAEQVNRLRNRRQDAAGRRAIGDAHALLQDQREPEG